MECRFESYDEVIHEAKQLLPRAPIKALEVLVQNKSLMVEDENSVEKLVSVAMMIAALNVNVSCRSKEGEREQMSVLEFILTHLTILDLSIGIVALFNVHKSDVTAEDCSYGARYIELIKKVYSRRNALTKSDNYPVIEKALATFCAEHECAEHQ